VILAGRDQELLDIAADEARVYGATTTDTVLFDAFDVTSARGAVAASFDKVDGEVDLVIIAVGLRGEQKKFENDAGLSAEMSVVTYAWPVAALAEVRRRLIAQGSGRILVMSSMAAIRVRRSDYLYDGAKAGLDRLCDGLSASLAGTDVSLQILRPGYVRSKMTAGTKERPFAIGVEEVAESVVRGLASGEQVIWCPRVMRYIAMLVRVTPRALWHKVADF
jgi:decaprenylphospho-beta-D-erythro-pentofuranosid-2-ulose 2-reductase